MSLLKKGIGEDSFDTLVDVELSDKNENPAVNAENTESQRSASSAPASVSSSSLLSTSTGKESKRPMKKTWKGPQNGRDLGVWESSLEDRANCLSRWFLSYLDPLLKLGSQKVLEQDDMGVPSKDDLADRAYSVARDAFEEQRKLAKAGNEEIKARYDATLAKCETDEQRAKVKRPKFKEPSIAIALVKGFGTWQLVLGLFYYIVSALLSFVPVLILNDLVKFFQSGLSIDEYNGFIHPWAEVMFLGVVPLLISLLQTRHQVIMSHCAVFVRTAVSTLLYRKCLRTSAAARAKTSTGQVVNMMSNDTAQLQRFLQFVGMVLVAPLQIIIALVLIFIQVGNATWVGVGFMIFLAPINMLVFSIVSRQRRIVLKHSDARVKMMNEILAGIRIIKFYAWERPFGKEVGQIRGHELDALTKVAYTSAIGFSLILLSAPLIQPILVFLTYVAIQDKPLDAATAFTTVALFNIMRFPFAFLPMGLLQYIQSKISLRRLERYLDLPELSSYVVSTPPPDTDDYVSSQSEMGSITIRNGSFSWRNPDAAPIRPINEAEHTKKSNRKSKCTPSGTPPKSSGDQDMVISMHSYASSVATEATLSAGASLTLQNLSFHIKAGSLVAVVGSVGSGKSSFLSAIMGEMEPIAGSKVYLPRPGKEESHYISYCAQTAWIVNDTVQGNILFGRKFDELRYTQVIEACSLIDDFTVLPAGDMTEIGERGINLSGGQKHRVALARALYSKETSVMLLDDPLSAVDAHVGEHIFANAIAGGLCKGVTRILVTHHVHLLPRCDYVIVLDKGRIAHMGSHCDLVALGVDFAGAVESSKHPPQEDGKVDAEKRGKSTDRDSIEPHDHKRAIADEKKAQFAKSGKRLVKDEEREEGSVATSSYMHYARVGGWWYAFSAVVIQTIGRAAEVFSGFWLALWAEQSSKNVDGVLPESETYFYLGIYAMFGILGIIGLTGRAIIIAVHRLHASRVLHDGLLVSILRAPVAFFDTTPTGRILNRFAADMDKIDLELTQSLSQGLSTIFSVLGSVAGMIAATKGTFLVPLIPIGYIYFVIQKWFRKTSTELQRVNSIANSPIFADFSQTLSGTSTIRAYGKERLFFEHCKHSFDAQNSSYILVQLANSWLGLRLDILGGVMGAFVGGVAVATYGANFIPAGWLGLALTYSIEMTGYLKHGVRMIATIEAQMNSVERVLFYTEHITSEAPEFIPEEDPPADEWPKDGEIIVENLSMRYRDGPLVLKDLSLTVKSGEKVGVCGRTGSGKSSFMIALFRISELEKSGRILIDGVDTSKIGTSTLRLNLSIIPQDPVIFSNSVRYNLDPFKTCSNKEVWEVLNKVKMGDVIAMLPGGLEEQVAEAGENFSQGQRQLLCIARALLRKPKILVMDEATASIDNSTDAAIQDMIRENFHNATVLTIAHRLNTITDSDRILVLDDGRIVEYDTPEALLLKDEGFFKKMLNQSRLSPK